LRPRRAAAGRGGPRRDWGRCRQDDAALRRGRESAVKSAVNLAAKPAAKPAAKTRRPRGFATLTRRRDPTQAYCAATDCVPPARF